MRPVAEVSAFAPWLRVFGGLMRGLTPTPKSTSRLRSSLIANARLSVETTPHIPKEGICGPRIIKGRPFRSRIKVAVLKQ